MKPNYSEIKGHSGTIYKKYNCSDCGTLLANHKEDLSNFCHNCGVKIDK